MKQFTEILYGIQERGTKRAALPQQEPPLPTGRIAQPAPYAEALPLALPGGKGWKKTKKDVFFLGGEEMLRLLFGRGV